MKVRYYIDPETDLPHIYHHDVAENEVEKVLESPGEDRAGSDGSRVAIGQTLAGRLLRGKPAFAYRRRRRKMGA